MRAGNLKERITIQEAVSITDQYGGSSIQLRDKITTKAAVFVAKKDREIINYAEFYPSIITVHVRIYHKINNTDVIVWEGNKYNILSVFKDKTRQLIEIKADLIRE